MKRQPIPFRYLLALTIALASLTACSSSRPSVVISSPSSGAQVSAGQDVPIRSTSTDAKDIASVELIVDNVVVRTDSAPGLQTSYALIQVWKASPGTHTISVRASNQDGLVSDPASIVITVLEPTLPAPTPSAPTLPAPTPISAVTPTTAPTTRPPTATVPPKPSPTVAPTLAPVTPAPASCVNNVALLEEIMSPDSGGGANQAFNKTWRVQNTGTCAWNANYQFALLGGEAMSPAGGIRVPDTPPGATADLTVGMTAPAAPGPHIGIWELRAPDGQFFGPTMEVRINVLNPQPPSCMGRPNVSTFTASPTSVGRGSLVTLSWGPVTNADRAEIVPDIGGVSTPGSIQIRLDKTTTFRLNGYCDNRPMAVQLTVNVSEGPAPTATPVRLGPTGLNGVWRGDIGTGYVQINLQSAFGCSAFPCPYTGLWQDSRAGNPILGTITQGTFDGNVFWFEAVPDLVGGARFSFTGQVGADGRTIVGTWGQVNQGGQVTFQRQ